jgi:hypothetical protein
MALVCIIFGIIGAIIAAGSDGGDSATDKGFVICGLIMAISSVCALAILMWVAVFQEVS